jgi:hypothetical protein
MKRKYGKEGGKIEKKDTTKKTGEETKRKFGKEVKERG